MNTLTIAVFNQAEVILTHVDNASSYGHEEMHTQGWNVIPKHGLYSQLST